MQNESPKVDFTPELAQLIGYTANVAIAIRLHSAYTEGNPYRMLCLPGSDIAKKITDPRQQSLDDLMWLSDSLNKLGQLGRAIADSSLDRIEKACDSLQSIYQLYIAGTDRFKGNPKETFDLHAVHIKLSDALAIFAAIKTKTLAAKSTS